MTSKERETYDEARSEILAVAERMRAGDEVGKLDLSGRFLTKLPPEIGQLTALTKLDLTRNKLTSLPAEMKNLTALTELFLHENPSLDLPAEVLGPEHRAVQKKTAAPASPQTILEYWFSTHGA